MSQYIVGLNIGNHDSAACLVKDGKLLCYAEQERFSRNKMAIGEAPIDALLYCLSSNNITLQEVEAIAIGMDWPYRNSFYGEPKYELEKYLAIDDLDRYLPKSVFGIHRPPIHYISHHLAHASSAYRLSGFEESAVLVIDNRGEDASSSLGVAKNGKISFLKKIDILNSLGVFYDSACRYTGLYGEHREVGKLMGLASYGIPNIQMPINSDRSGNLYQGLPSIDGCSIFTGLQIRKKQLEEYFLDNCFPYEQGNADEIMSYANFAASAQNALESIISDFVLELKEITGLNNLVIAGGIALNCSANGKIEQAGIFKNIYIPPFASDGGTAIGAALELDYALYQRCTINSKLTSASLGVAYEDEEVLAALNNYKDKLHWLVLPDEELFKRVAKAITVGGIICWMQGAFEAGPRALGNRSILADPRKRNSLIRLNNIKNREMWRPIAPSILIDHYAEYFSGNSDNKQFMNFAVEVHKDKQKLIPAVVHVDGTARPQVVSEQNYKYHGLLTEFYRVTGIPVLCNTSFNMKGYPLVNSPRDAVECYLDRDFDLLVIGNILIYKR